MVGRSSRWCSSPSTCCTGTDVISGPDTVGRQSYAGNGDRRTLSRMTAACTKSYAASPIWPSPAQACRLILLSMPILDVLPLDCPKARLLNTLVDCAADLPTRMTVR